MFVSPLKTHVGARTTRLIAQPTFVRDLKTLVCAQMTPVSALTTSLVGQKTSVSAQATRVSVQVTSFGAQVTPVRVQVTRGLSFIKPFHYGTYGNHVRNRTHTVPNWQRRERSAAIGRSPACSGGQAE